jgi:hypothetical protein
MRYRILEPAVADRLLDVVDAGPPEDCIELNDVRKRPLERFGTESEWFESGHSSSLVVMVRLTSGVGGGAVLLVSGLTSSDKSASLKTSREVRHAERTCEYHDRGRAQ